MAREQTRRQWLKTAAAAGTASTLGLAGCTDGGNGNGGGSAEGTVKIGLMQPLTGDVQYYGQQSLWGFLSGMAYKYDQDPLDVSTSGEETIEADDVTYELYVEDSQFSPDQAQTLATDLVQDQEVDMLCGIASSDGARRVIDVAKQAGVPYLAGPAAAADLTSDSELCGEQIFRASENTAMDARSGGRYVAQETDVERVFIMAADYSFGRAVARNYKNVLESEGIEIVGERYVPRGHDQFGGLFENAVEANADAVIGGFTVVTLPNFLDEGLSGEYGLRMFGGFATEISTAAIGGVAERVLGDLTAEKIQDALLGPFTSRYHWNQYDNEINSAFVDAYTSTYGKVPDLFTSGMFAAASSIAQAVEAGGSTDGADIASEMRGMTIAETPKGEDAYTYQEYNNQARSEMTVAYPVPNTEDNWDAPIMPGEPLARISADETTLPEDSSEMGCSL
ncbi:ABC transporter substrate-binding protein [Natronomonas salina]|uniref:ABC transporter substrate-binding protein n=1 Tax=Natronomonas salina TaxID=1710540 RepID=UPI0015B4CCB4|nr:ABC transporter substrate-binding protein [Natronomonas salina]QLD90068.1 ABC transporter substrate-binding protein [Natronomonas salina]